MPIPLLPLTDWQSFYVIVGSSGAALIGLQFVVIALVAELRARSSQQQIGAFATPTIVHFGAALLVSTIMSAPWRELASVAFALRVTGILGVAYVILAVTRGLGQSEYKPVWEDWLWHSILPFIAYSAILVAAFLIPARAESALFVVAAGALSLLFIGIHNAWDTVTFIVVERGGKTAAGAHSAEKSSAKPTEKSSETSNEKKISKP